MALTCGFFAFPGLLLFWGVLMAGSLVNREPNFVGLTSGLDDSKTLEHHGYEVVPGLLVQGPEPEVAEAVAALDAAAITAGLARHGNRAGTARR